MKRQTKPKRQTKTLKFTCTETPGAETIWSGEPVAINSASEPALVSVTIPTRAELEAEIERLRSALQAIAEGGVEKVHAAIYRKDGQHTEHDSCPHGRAIWDDCERCMNDFARKALEGGKG